VVGAEQDLVAAKHRDTQLAFALLLKFYGRFGRFPRGRAELHDDAVEFVARQLGVDAGSLGFYEWTGRTIKRHRAEIRAHHGFRECTVADAERLTGWLAGDYAQQERRYELVRDALLGECRSRSIESPTPDRVERIVRSGLHQAERALAERVAGRLPVEVRARLLALVQVPDTDVDEADPSVLALIKVATGNVSLSSMLTEISRLEAVRAVGLPAGLFADVAPKVLAGWRARAAVESPSHLREHSDELTVTLLAALVHCRTWEITDALVTLLLRTVHADVLEFRCDNSHRPVLDALALVHRYRGETDLTYYPAGETAPTHPGLSGDWAELAHRVDGRGRRRTVRTVYEIRTFEALCDQLKCKGVWVVGAMEFRNPDEDLPRDFDTRRTEHYQALRKPLDPSAFIDGLRQEMRTELGTLNDAMPLSWLEIRPRPGNQGAVKLSPLEALPEPQNLGRLKKVIVGRWGTVPLIDVLKEAILRSNCRTTIGSMFGRGDVAGGQLLERLLLVLYAYGTNTGIRAVAAGEHGHREEELYYIRRRAHRPRSTGCAGCSDLASKENAAR